MPSATKNSVTKKSRILVTLAMTSMLYGNVDMLTPAMSAPISRESPSRSAAPLTKKHQARAAINISSGTLAAKENKRGSTYRLKPKVMNTSPAPLTKDSRRVPSRGSWRFGCSARKTIAQIS